MVFLLTAITANAVRSQDFPDKIRGYKVYKTEVSVNDSSPNGRRAVSLEFGEPEVGSISVTGVNLVFQTSLKIEDQSGSVDFITFKDFEVNGIKVDIAEFGEEFDFEKGVSTVLPEMIKVFVGAGQLIKGAYSELKDSKKDWRVRGRVFVFGKFKKFGFKFKRVVPVDVDFYIPNPLLPKPASGSSKSDLLVQSSRFKVQSFGLDGERSLQC